MARRLGNLVRVRPSRRAFARAAATANPVRFAFNQASRVTEPRAYRLRGTRLRVVVQHGTEDVSALTEVFAERDYAEPPEVARRLATVEHPRVLDLGANIGCYALWAFRHHPGARVTSVEPDPRNLALLHRARELSPGVGWTVVAAAAGAHECTARLDAGLRTGSRLVEDGRGIAVEQHDVVPWLAGFDLVKCDIEGSEWPILEDPRLAAAAPPALVLEYHPRPGAPGTARARATELLRGAGLEVAATPEKAPDVGLLWAWRPSGAPEPPG